MSTEKGEEDATVTKWGIGCINQGNRNGLCPIHLAVMNNHMVRPYIFYCQRNLCKTTSLWFYIDQRSFPSSLRLVFSEMFRQGWFMSHKNILQLFHPQTPSPLLLQLFVTHLCVALLLVKEVPFLLAVIDNTMSCIFSWR